MSTPQVDAYLKTQAARQQHAERFEAVMLAVRVFNAMYASGTYSEAEVEKARAAYLDALDRLGDEAS